MVHFWGLFLQHVFLFLFFFNFLFSVTVFLGQWQAVPERANNAQEDTNKCVSIPNHFSLTLSICNTDERAILFYFLKNCNFDLSNATFVLVCNAIQKTKVLGGRSFCDLGHTMKPLTRKQKTN